MTASASSAATTELCDLARQSKFILVDNPADIREVAELGSVSIVPLRLGAGKRLKILDSMALGAGGEYQPRPCRTGA
jgi:hypothetical protein